MDMAAKRICVVGLAASSGTRFGDLERKSSIVLWKGYCSAQYELCELYTPSLRSSFVGSAWIWDRWDEPPLTPTCAPPLPPPSQAAHAVRARLVSWFLDTPVAPFGVDRMALAGKAAGKDVGVWFGPSAAAGALRMLVDAFSVCGLGVSVVTAGTLYQTEVFAASHSPAALATLHAHSRASSALSPSHATSSSHGKHAKPETKTWGNRPVLLILGIRLGLDGMIPVYHDTTRYMLYTFPQSVGIAGGRPSSSYYFVGSGLFYLDPHHSLPAVPLRPYMGEAAPLHPHDGHHAPDDRRSLNPEAYARDGSMSPEFARGGSMSPELVYPHGGSMSPEYSHGQGNTTMTKDELVFILSAPTPPGRACKMALSGLDPSMLIGFVVRDEAGFRALFHPSGSFMLSTTNFIRTGLRANPTAGKGDITVIDVTRQRWRGPVDFLFGNYVET
ncbi:hypothetical protein C8R43DRAFT_959475 [Mycena crocata]|nr:hypothetical protein C8R43DRAFT_959475 [Mycena crocata]